MGIVYDSNEPYVHNNNNIIDLIKKCVKIKGSCQKLCDSINFNTSSFKNYINMKAKTFPLFLLDNIKISINDEFNEMNNLVTSIDKQIKEYKNMLFFNEGLTDKHPCYKDIENNIVIKEFTKRIVRYCGGNYVNYSEKTKESNASLRIGISPGILRNYIYPAKRYNISNGQLTRSYVDIIDLQILIDIYSEIKKEIISNINEIDPQIKIISLGDIVKERTKIRKKVDLQILQKNYYNHMYKTLSNRYNINNWTSIHAKLAVTEREHKNNKMNDTEYLNNLIDIIKNNHIQISLSLFNKLKKFIPDICMSINSRMDDKTLQIIFLNKWRKYKSTYEIFGEKIEKIFDIKSHLLISLMIDKIEDIRKSINYLMIIDRFGEINIEKIQKITDEKYDDIYRLLIQILNIGILKTKRNFSIWEINKNIKETISEYWNKKINNIITQNKVIPYDLFSI